MRFGQMVLLGGAVGVGAVGLGFSEEERRKKRDERGE